MTVQEFSDLFDVLYNNITSNQAPGLNEYEKSVFLTKALDEIVKNYFSPKGNPKQDGFDDSPKRLADFAAIIKTSPLASTSSSSKFDKRSIAFIKPEDMFICLNELISDGGNPITVVPISYSEYDRLMSKPYKYPPKYQAWRLTTDNAVVSASVSKASYTYGAYTFVTASTYNKPVRFIINTVMGASLYPIIEETSSIVTITCIIGPTLNGRSISDVSEYWSAYLAPGSNVTSPYLEDFNSTTLGIFPTIPIDLSWEEMEKFVDVTNPGGTSGGTKTIFEIIGRFSLTPIYTMRYIRRPAPIILVNLRDIQNSLTIQEHFTPLTSELSEELHEEILQRAVELAKIAWAGNLEQIATVNMATTAGQRSE